MADDGDDFFRSSSSDQQVSDPNEAWGLFGPLSPSKAGSGSRYERDTGRSSAPREQLFSASANRLSTGILEIDRAMNGGVPPGRLVALVSEPGVQSKLLLESVLAQRQTLYVATDRPEWEVEQDLDPEVGHGDVVIKEVPPEELLDSQAEVLDEVNTGSNLVVDAINELELVSRERYRTFLSSVKRVLYETGSMGLLYGVTVDQESARDMTLRRADIVWRLKTTIEDNGIETRLFVPKFQGGAANPEAVKLMLTDEIRVDTSRHIA